MTRVHGPFQIVAALLASTLILSIHAAPPPPTEVVATSGDSQVLSSLEPCTFSFSSQAFVSWLAPAGNIITYIVSAHPGSQSTTLNGSPPSTSAAVTGLTNLQEYTFTVVAKDSLGGTSVASFPCTTIVS